MNFFKSLKFRYLRFFLIGLAAIFAVEACVIIYINNFYLKDSGAYNTKILTPTSSENQIKQANIESGAQNLAGSHDGRYVAYEKNGALNILDMTTGKTFNAQSVANAQVSCFKWVYDRDRLIIAEKTITGGNYYVKLYYFDMKDRTLTEIRDNTNNVDIKIYLSYKTDNVTDIEMSTEIVKTYVKVTSQNNKNKIWEVDAGNPDDRLVSLGKTITGNIGNIQSLKLQDHLLYEDADNGKVYMYGYRTAIAPADGSTSLSLLGFDGSDNVYFADTKGGLTRTVYCGSYDAARGKWSWPSTVKLGKAVSAGQIYIGYDGSIYYNDKANNTLVKAWPIGGSGGTSSDSSSTTSSSKSSSSKASGSSSETSSGLSENGTKYAGKIISVFDSGFLAIYNNQITPHFFK